MLILSSPPPISAHVLDHRSQTVVIQGRTQQTGSGILGSGVIIARHGSGVVILTACHVIRDVDKTSLQVFYGDGEQASLLLHSYCLPGYDLAFISTATSPNSAQAATIGALTFGDQQLTLLGHPNGKPYVSTALRWAYPYTNDPFPPDEFVSACLDICARGDSGGGVWDTHGNLVGIAIELAENPAGDDFLVSENITILAVVREMANNVPNGTILQARSMTH